MLLFCILILSLSSAQATPEYKIYVGNSITLYDGYELKIADIDVSGTEVLYKLLKMKIMLILEFCQ